MPIFSYSARTRPSSRSRTSHSGTISELYYSTVGNRKRQKKDRIHIQSVILLAMNPIQQALLDIARSEDIEKIRRVDLLKRVGCEYPSQITHHLMQLVKRGELVRRDGRLMPSISTPQGLVRVAVMGEADCGEATKFADGRIMDTLAISPSLLSIQNYQSVYALIARGDSMNRCSINGKFIEDGDYVIVRRADGYLPGDNEVIVSIIGGLANVKRFVRDTMNGRLLLLSDSHRQRDFAPIIISEDDEFQVEAQVVDVIKGLSV